MAEIPIRDLHLILSSALHFLRAPLARVYCAGQELRDSYSDCLDETGLFFAENICQGSEEMEAAFAGLSEVAAIYGSDAEFASVPVVPLLDDVLEEARELYPQRAVAIGASVAAVRGDRALLFKAVLALVENALRFSASIREGVVEVSVVEREDGKEIVVVDNGVGFDTAQSSKLFIPFGRLHRKDGLSGQGVGLALVKAIAIHHGGTVSAEGEPGRGATFRLFLPDQK